MEREREVELTNRWCGVGDHRCRNARCWYGAGGRSCSQLRGGKWSLTASPCRQNCSCRWCTTGEGPSRWCAIQRTRAGRAWGFRLRRASGKWYIARLAEDPSSFALHDPLLRTSLTTTTTLDWRNERGFTVPPFPFLPSHPKRHYFCRSYSIPYFLLLPYP